MAQCVARLIVPGMRDQDREGRSDRGKPMGWWARILSASTWQIAVFWVLVALGLTLFFEPIVAERAARRALQSAIELFCSAGAKCI